MTGPQVQPTRNPFDDIAASPSGSPQAATASTGVTGGSPNPFDVPESQPAPLPSNMVGDRLGGLLKSIGETDRATTLGAARGVLSSVAQLPDVVEGTRRTINTIHDALANTALGKASPQINIPIVEDAISKGLDGIHSVMGPISDALQGVVNSILPEHPDYGNDQHPMLSEFMHKGGDVVGNIIGAVLMGKVIGAAGNKAADLGQPNKLVTTVKNLDAAASAMQPTVTANYESLGNLPRINTNIDSRLQDLVNHSDFSRVAKLARQLDEDRGTVHPLEVGGEPLPSQPTSTVVSMANGNGPSGLVPPPGTSVTPPSTLPIPFAGDIDPIISARATTIPQEGDLSVQTFDSIKKFFQRNSINNAASKAGLKADEAQNMKSIISKAIDAVDDQMPKVPDPENPGGQISQYALTRQLGQQHILIKQASEILKDKLTSPELGEVNVASGKLSPEINEIASNIEKSGGGVTGGMIKSMINAYRYRSGNPLGRVASILWNGMNGPVRNDEAVLGDVVRTLGEPQNGSSGGKAISIIQKGLDDARSNAPGYVAGQWLKYLPYATVKQSGVLDQPPNPMMAGVGQQ